MAALSVDAATASVVGSLVEVGIPSVLLKGPAIARRFYSGGERSYCDMDLLVPPAGFAAAESTLEALGFVPMLERFFPGSRGEPGRRGRREAERATGNQPHANTWIKQGHPAVDLHLTFPGLLAPPQAVWQAFSATEQHLNIAGGQVKILELSAQALIIVLHARSNAAKVSPRTERADRKSREDLRRALAQLPFSTWEQALSCARRLSAVRAFAEGLALCEEGRALAADLGVSEEQALGRGSGPSGAAYGRLHLHHWVHTPGVLNKLKLGASLAFPSRSYMRYRWHFARRGPVALAVAYGLHLCRASLRLPRAALVLVSGRHSRSEPDETSSS